MSKHHQRGLPRHPKVIVDKPTDEAGHASQTVSNSSPRAAGSTNLAEEAGDTFVRLVNKKKVSTSRASTTSTIDKPDKFLVKPSEDSGKRKSSSAGTEGEGTKKKKKRGSKAKQLAVAGQTDDKRGSFNRHKTNLQSSLKELNHVINKELGMGKAGDGKAGVSPAANAKADANGKQSNNARKEAEDAEKILEKKQYAEEELDFEEMQAKMIAQEEERCYAWIDKAMHRVLFITSILVIVAALMTALGCYIFVQLPVAIYSTHILKEAFVYKDELIEANRFSMGFGLRTFAPLPTVIVMLYAIILYFIYLVQYPKQKPWIIYARYCLFVNLELYLLLAALSYLVHLGYVESRLDEFNRHDKAGLNLPLEKLKNEKLHVLERAQEYFGCCGYRNKNEWAEVFPDLYGAKADKNATWPLSCCDEEKSGVACYGPVMERVIYRKRNDEDDEDPDDMTTYNESRLYSDHCFPKEYALCMTVISLVCLLLVVFSALATWNVVVFVQLTHLVTTKNLEMRQKEMYIDFF